MCDGHARIYIAINISHADHESGGDSLRVLTFEGTVSVFFYICMPDRFKRYLIELEFLKCVIWEERENCLLSGLIHEHFLQRLQRLIVLTSVSVITFKNDLEKEIKRESLIRNRRYYDMLNLMKSQLPTRRIKCQLYTCNGAQ
jgi:hypothetical protein